jgi:hypothetical protein
MWVCVCAPGFRIFALLCCSATRGGLLWTTAFSSRTLSRRVWRKERNHRNGIGVCEGEMFGHVVFVVFAARRGGERWRDLRKLRESKQAWW